MSNPNEKNNKSGAQDLTDIQSFTTDPWTNAEKAPESILDTIIYPDLKGMDVMLINPDCHYRKKFLGLGLGYIATAMQRCKINVTVTDCSAWHYDDIEIGKILIQIVIS